MKIRSWNAKEIGPVLRLKHPIHRTIFEGNIEVKRGRERKKIGLLDDLKDVVGL